MKSCDNTEITLVDSTFTATFYQPSRIIHGKLVVHGKVLDATPGLRLRLVPATPRGFNPRDLNLVLEAVPPRDIEVQREVETDVSYSKSMKTRLYDTVSISNSHGPGLTVNVSILVSEG